MILCHHIRHISEGIYDSSVWCPSMEATPLGPMCVHEGEREHWWENDGIDSWRGGEACRETCMEYIMTLGPGCCEAQHRVLKQRSECWFFPNGKLHNNTNVHVHGKAVLCKGKKA